VRKGSPAFTVETFEYVEAGPDLVLLRLSGRWRSRRATSDGVELIVVSAAGREPLMALPAPPAADGSWRAAFSASRAVLSDPSTSFELDAGGGRPIPLPTPVTHATAAPEPEPEPVAAAVVEPAPDPRDALAAERAARQAAESLAAAERARAQRAEALLAEELRKTVGKTEELIDRIDVYEQGRVSFEEELAAVRRTHADLLAEARDEHALELAALRDELHKARTELATALDELEAVNEHVDTLHEAHSLELGAARLQRDAAEQRQSALDELVTEMRAEMAALDERLEDREALIERARAAAAAGASDTADLHAAVLRLRDAIATRARDTATARRRFSRTPEELDRSREELARDADRIAALERQAEALRDAIHSQLPYSLHASPLQEALPLEPEAQSEA
jgi:hypothetical protein